MTRKIYKTAQGKSVDLGALMLQNENIRAVGNMNVNARGDILDSTNQVIDQKTRQVQRQYQRQTNVSSAPIINSTREAKSQRINGVVEPAAQPISSHSTVEGLDAPAIIEPTVIVTAPDPIIDPVLGDTSGGLAAAIARAKTVKQELEKTSRQKAQEQPIKRI